jgi:hypothetical protein
VSHRHDTNTQGQRDVKGYRAQSPPKRFFMLLTHWEFRVFLTQCILQCQKEYNTVHSGSHETNDPIDNLESGGQYFNQKGQCFSMFFSAIFS